MRSIEQRKKLKVSSPDQPVVLSLNVRRKYEYSLGRFTFSPTFRNSPEQYGGSGMVFSGFFTACRNLPDQKVSVHYSF